MAVSVSLKLFATTMNVLAPEMVDFALNILWRKQKDSDGSWESFP